MLLVFILSFMTTFILNVGHFSGNKITVTLIVESDILVSVPDSDAYCDCSDVLFIWY